MLRLIAPAFVAACMAAAWNTTAYAQARDERDARIDALAAQLKAMQAQLDAQRAELEQQRAELEASDLESFSGEAGLPADEHLLRVYGFAEVGLQRSWGSLAELIPGGTKTTTFVLGNVNLYFDSNPVPEWRFLAEVRFGLFPHGSVPRGAARGALATISDRVSDDGSSNGGFTDLTWHGVLLERAHIDWMPSDEFNLRAGWFLTPYGIWNVDHGSPTRLVIEPPLFITLELFPQRQLGVEAFGSLPALPWTFGYHAYVSNGRQPGQLDFEDEKALGFRLWASTRQPVPVAFGLSGYTGHYEDVDKTFGVDADGGLFASTNEKIAFRDYAVSADLSIDVDSLRIRSEGVARWKLYEDGKRDADLPGTLNADVMTFGAYVMIAYQLPWYGLEPVLMTELVRPASPIGEYGGRLGGGLNIYLSEVTTLRMSYMYSWLFDLEGPERDLRHNEQHSAAARLIMAF